MKENSINKEKRFHENLVKTEPFIKEPVIHTNTICKGHLKIVRWCKIIKQQDKSWVSKKARVCPCFSQNQLRLLCDNNSNYIAKPLKTAGFF